MITYPDVIDEWTTITLIKRKGLSIARYGDGELKLIRGASIKCQKYDPNLSSRLKFILVSDTKCLIGIPNIADLSAMEPLKQQFWSNYQSKTAYYNLNKVYVSSFITRPDSAPVIDSRDYFDAVKGIWRDRRVILINGNNRRFDKDPSILDTVASWERWERPAQDAWSGYAELLAKCQREPLDTLFVIALGPTATVLAYDLCQVGYQALDMGHIGMFYARQHPNDRIGKLPDL